MFKRELETAIKIRAEKIPVIAILGPRQSGKTTIAREIFNNHTYVSLEDYEERELATSDPRRFLEINKSPQGIILDEIQHVPSLLSYIQTYVDEEHRPGNIVITGSQNILISQAISQTLAGRIAIFTLLPLSITELSENNIIKNTIEKVSYMGGYPRVYAYDLEPTQWYSDYIETYVERDVRSVGAIANLQTFKRFIRLCAGRIGQLLNLASLANDCGIDQRTAKSWISILEASYIIFLLQPHYVNFNKRLIKSPKLYFYDTGLACALLDIESAEQLDTHYLRGNIVESLVIAEIAKYYYNQGKRPHIYFWRNQTGNEIDCIIEQGDKLTPIEVKASKTIAPDFFKGLVYWNELAQKPANQGYVIYAGPKNQERSTGTVISWKNIDSALKSR